MIESYAHVELNSINVYCNGKSSIKINIERYNNRNSVRFRFPFT